MPYTLRRQERYSLYPVVNINNRKYDPYKSYFLYRTEGCDHFTTHCIGLLKKIEGNFYFVWLDTYGVDKIESKYNDSILDYVADYFDIIEVSSEDYSNSERSIDLNRCAEVHFEVIENLINEKNIERRTNNETTNA